MGTKYKIIFGILSAILTIAFVLCGVFCYWSSYERLWETLGDFCQSIGYYVSVIFDLERASSLGVINPSEVLKIDVNLPERWAAFVPKVEAFFEMLVSQDNLLGYMSRVGKITSKAAKIICLLLPCVLLGWVLLRQLYNAHNNNFDEDTVPLKVFKWIAGHTYQPIKRGLLRYLQYLRERDYIRVIWVFLWICNLNLTSIVVAFFAYYFYFAVSFKFDTIYMQIYKLVVDLQVVVRTVPLWLLLIVAYWLFLRTRERMAQEKLRHFEARNCGFIKDLPIVSLTCGTMGAKKTTMITDMALSQEAMLRQKARELLEDNDMKFPHFPWISFERDILKQMDEGVVFNLASTKKWVQERRKAFDESEDKGAIVYGYQWQKYGVEINDGLAVYHLFDILETYAQLYFIYVIESSLIVSNYSIRSDNELVTEGNFPEWSTDFFPRHTKIGGHHSHILDFDVLRIGKKVVENNPRAGSFEFGVIVISEIGKERGNNLELREVKKNEASANQKNDLFNSWLKMSRHSATVGHYPFIKFFADEQRPESWGADARELTQIIRIRESSERRLAMPFYTIEEMLTEWVVGGVNRLYYYFRFRRGDNTLLVHVLKSISAWLYLRNLRYWNRFGYTVSKVDVEDGTMDGKRKRKKYFIMSKKVYSKRFATDCFSDYFNDMALQSEMGLNDYMEYESERATVAELREQNSYFIGALYPDADESSGSE